jgi:hypothetical protein
MYVAGIGKDDDDDNNNNVVYENWDSSEQMLGVSKC